MKICRESLRQLPERNALLRLCHRVRSALKNGLLPPERLGNLDLRKEKTRPLTKRALLSYIVHPFATLPDATRFPPHINIWHAWEMVRVLNQLGFIVDVVDYRDEGFAPSQRYDLFIGHGGINYLKIADRLPASATKIYFSTGCYWKFHNEQELARFSALRERRGVSLPPDRLITTSEEEALLAADGIVGIGNDFTKNTYVGYSPITMINGTSLFDDHYDQHDKNFDKGREHFLYFAGSGNVHKGLDLLLEAFADLRQHLWICSKIDQGFADVYSKELHDLPNIHLVSWVQGRSAKFYEMMDTCNFVILPSCSEGQAQSVVE